MSEDDKYEYESEKERVKQNKQNQSEEELNKESNRAENKQREAETLEIQVYSQGNLEHFQKQIRKSMESFTFVQERIHKTLQSLSIGLNEGISRAVCITNGIRQRIESVFNSVEFREQLRQIQEGAKRLKEITPRFKAIMLEIGFPPHSSILMFHINDIVQIYDNRGVEYTKRLIERYMTLFVYREEEIRGMQETWQKAKWLEKRIEVINCVIDGHLKGYYQLTVPTLLAQIEGILVDGILTLDEIKPNDKIGYGKQKNFLTQVILGETGVLSFDEQIEEFYTTIILANFERGKEINSDLSRHAILHGEDTNYGTKLNSLKTILIFNYFFEKLDELYKDIEKSKYEIQQRRKRKSKGYLIKKKGTDANKNGKSQVAHNYRRRHQKGNQRKREL